MNAYTKYFGEITYEKKDILYFPNGLFGFEHEKNFILIHFEDDDDTLLCMQSLQEESLAFILMNPFHLLPGYSPELTEEDMAALSLSDNSAMSYYVICVIHDHAGDSTVNLKCPVAINPKNRIARQVILDNSSYFFRHTLKELSSRQKEGSFIADSTT